MPFFSECVSEACWAFNNHVPFICPPVGTKEFRAQTEDTDDDQAIAPTPTTLVSKASTSYPGSKEPEISKRSHSRNSSTYARNIPRRILTPKDSPSTDPRYAPKRHKQRAAKSPFPLSSGVVCLVGKCCRYVSVHAGRDEEDAEVASCAWGGETHNRETDESDEGIGDEDGATDVVVVAEIGGEGHEESGENVLCETGEYWWKLWLIYPIIEAMKLDE